MVAFGSDSTNNRTAVISYFTFGCIIDLISNPKRSYLNSGTPSNSHKNWKDYEMEKYECCGQTFNTKEEMETHKKNAHSSCGCHK